MINVISVDSKVKNSTPDGSVRNILDPGSDGTRVQVSLREVEPGKTSRVAPSDRTQVVYILEGKDAKVRYTISGNTSESVAQRRAGVYLEPGDEAAVTASDGPLLLLFVTVPKHTGKPNDNRAPAGYYFEEARLRSLVDEKRFRERTFWVDRKSVV